MGNRRKREKEPGEVDRWRREVKKGFLRAERQPQGLPPPTPSPPAPPAVRLRPSSITALFVTEVVDV